MKLNFLLIYGAISLTFLWASQSLCASQNEKWQGLSLGDIDDESECHRQCTLSGYETSFVIQQLYHPICRCVNPKP